MADILQKIASNLYEGEDQQVAELVQDALDQGVAPGEILQSGLIAGMDIIGGRFKRNEIYIPEVLIAARAMNASMDILKPELVKAGVMLAGEGLHPSAKGKRVKFSGGKTTVIDGPFTEAKDKAHGMLAEAVREGRRREFAKFEAFADPHQRERGVQRDDRDARGGDAGRPAGARGEFFRAGRNGTGAADFRRGSEAGLFLHHPGWESPHYPSGERQATPG